MKSTSTLKFDPPLETLGELKAALDDFTEQHPNPTGEPRQVRLVTTLNGRIKQITVTTEQKDRS